MALGFLLVAPCTCIDGLFGLTTAGSGSASGLVSGHTHTHTHSCTQSNAYNTRNLTTFVLVQTPAYIGSREPQVQHQDAPNAVLSIEIGITAFGGCRI